MKHSPRLRLGTTPCPNDSYLLGALATGQVDLPGIDLALERADIETLNAGVLAGDYDIAKISCAVYAGVADDYALLDVGAALADGHGPLVLARRVLSPREIACTRMVAPGEHTTGTLLLRHWAPAAPDLAWRTFDRIIDALVDGEFELGVVIHEARFTYAARGLHCLVDLGQWWQRTRGLPVPLGCYVIRRTLYARYARAVEQMMLNALARAASGDAAIRDYIRAHAQELDDTAIDRHIGLYVNRHTYALGARGRHAIAALGTARRAALA